MEIEFELLSRHQKIISNFRHQPFFDATVFSIGIVENFSGCYEEYTTGYTGHADLRIASVNTAA